MMSMPSPPALRMASTQRAACFRVAALSISSDTGMGMALTAVNPASTLTCMRSRELARLDGLVHAFQAAAAQMIVEAQRVAHRPAEQFADRLAQFFALDVPQRLVDAADGRHSR